MPGNSKRKGAVRNPSTKKGAVIGSGGKGKKSLAPKGATPKAADRTYFKHRKKSNETLVAKPKARNNALDLVLGRNPVLECLQADIAVKTMFLAEKSFRDSRILSCLKICAQKNIPVLEVTKSELDKITNNGINQGIALQIKSFQYTELDDFFSNLLIKNNPIVLALDNIVDPHNFGAIIRSANAFGVEGIIIPKNRSVKVTPTVWRTSAGAVAKLPIIQITNLAQSLKLFANKGFHIVGLDVKAKTPYYQYDTNIPLVLVIGAEGKGIGRLVAANCDDFTNIPMPGGFQSLNAAVATSIVLAEFTRENRKF